MRETVLAPYDEEWPRRFEAEREMLERVLAPWLREGVYHVGSTAVVGLAAKPVIDMIAGVASLEQARTAREPLESLGYVYGEHRPEALWFRKPGGEWWEATHSLHLTEPGSDLWRERLAFRDALRADAALAAEYERWKIAHARTTADQVPYGASKTTFVATVLARAGIVLKPDHERLTAAARAGRTPTVRLAPWGSGDLPLLERLMGDPRMTGHLGGPESPDKLRQRQVRYERLEGGDRMFKIVDVASGSGVGSVGFWTKEWRATQVYEIGWMVVPEFQGRGIAAAATAQAIELAKRDDKHRLMHAFPNVDNAPSNAICRRLGFELLEACEFEFPKGHFMTCNDWRLDLRAS